MSDTELDAELPVYGIYEGERNEQGLRHGQGKNTFGNGDIYQGQYQNGKRHGHGQFTFKSTSASYTGDYSNGQRTGRGVFKYPDQSVYDGQWVDGKRSGMGTYTYANGDVFEGQWADDKKSGSGVYTFRDTGVKKVGTWTADVLSGPGKIVMNDSEFAGSFGAGDRIDGPVQVTFKNNHSAEWTDSRLIARLSPAVST